MNILEHPTHLQWSSELWGLCHHIHSVGEQRGEGLHELVRSPEDSEGDIGSRKYIHMKHWMDRICNYMHFTMVTIRWTKSLLPPPIERGGGNKEVGVATCMWSSTSKEQGQLEAGSKSTLAPPGAINTADTSLMVYCVEGESDRHLEQHFLPIPSIP